MTEPTAQLPRARARGARAREAKLSSRELLGTTSRVERLNAPLNAVATCSISSARTRAGRPRGTPRAAAARGGRCTAAGDDKDTFETAGCGRPRARHGARAHNQCDRGAALLTRAAWCSARQRAYPRRRVGQCNPSFGVTRSTLGSRAHAGRRPAAPHALAASLTPRSSSASIGGSSVRPSELIGVYGLKPSDTCIVPQRGIPGPPESSAGNRPPGVVGPMARGGRSRAAARRRHQARSRSCRKAGGSRCRRSSLRDYRARRVARRPGVPVGPVGAAAPQRGGGAPDRRRGGRVGPACVRSWTACAPISASLRRARGGLRRRSIASWTRRSA
jgi:hypothetical protein